MRPIHLLFGAIVVLACGLAFGTADSAFAAPSTSRPAGNVPIQTVSSSPAFSASIPVAPGGSALTSGDDLADNQGTTSTTSAEYFGTNQAATTAGGMGPLWWVITIGGLAIILLAWFGYRELV